MDKTIEKEYFYPLTVLTPTYNRKKYLINLYESLCRQTNRNFQWLIIDDGSTDNTEDIVKAFDNSKFRIDYYKKINGGKHTALNFSHSYIEGYLTIIVDSDDELVDDAVDTIIDAGTQYLRNTKVKIISFLKGDRKRTPYESSFPETPTISNHIDFRLNAGRSKDCSEIMETDAFKSVVFPQYEDEKFLGEGYLWNNLGRLYDTVYINKLIYIGNYLEGGLSKSGRKLRIRCPKGGMANCNSFFSLYPQRKLSDKFLKKEAILFVCYGKFAKLKYKQIIERCVNPNLAKKNYLFGCMLYILWKIKYE